MQTHRVCGGLRVLVSFFSVLWPVFAWSQAASPQSRIVQPVDEGARVTLRGNTHPLAQAQFDRGAAPPDLPMARMLLVLKRSEAQEAALQKLLDDQQDQSSSSHHQWLTPDQFGQQFGPSDQDIQAVTAWLGSHGFQIGQVGRGRTVIEFSGTAAQVQQAFRTEIHKFTVNGEDHWANASDPQIPAAFSPVVEGVASLHNFPRLPQYRIAGKFSRDRVTGQLQTLSSDFTTVDSSLCHLSGTAGYCYFVGPYDFATIYNVLPLWNAGIDGAGQNIAIVGESNINIQDVRDFRNLFGLPANDPQIFLNGGDPGIVQGPETEALLDVEWSGAVAKGATIKLVVSAPTNSTAGADLAGLYAVENNLAPVVSESFGDCELFLGTAGNSFESAVRQQAAAQGITYINSSGDEGSARCDTSPPPYSPPAPAKHGLMVSGLASTPYGVAVGGTDFLNFGPNFNFNSPSPYWSTSNNNHQASAQRYVPETTWNQNCTNPAFVAKGAGSTPEASCNNPQLIQVVETVASGGGKSSCITSDQTNTSSCGGGYAKPSWQNAPGVPADQARDIPDVSLFASSGFFDSAYIVCESDLLPSPQPCSLTTPHTTFLGVGGTSAAAPSFAGIMALVNQYTKSSGQGNANYVLYRLASSSMQTSNNCNASTSPSSSCIFYDVTAGTNAVPCANGTPDCTPSSGDQLGILPGYNAAQGYDLATGLGSVNAYNLAHAWNTPSTPSSVTLSLTPATITHGQSMNYNITVTPGAATGEVSLIGSPTSTGPDGIASFVLQNGAASGTTQALPGGTGYAVKAHYPGDTTYAPSDSAAVAVTVGKEASKPVIWVGTPSNPVLPSNPPSVGYGVPIGAFVGVGNAQATAAIPPQPVCMLLSCPTGAVTVSDSLNGGAPTLLSPSSGFPLDITGIAQGFSFVPAGGQHIISANYAGDNSYLAGSGSYSLTVTPAVTTMNFIDNFESVLGSPVLLSAEVTTFGPGLGIAPTGTITFTDGSTPLSETVSYLGASGLLKGSISHAFTAAGRHNITMVYSGDANYRPTSVVMSGLVFFPDTISVSASPIAINAGQTVTITATTTSPYNSPPMTGKFQFSGTAFNGCFSCLVTPSLSTDATGNQVATATAVSTPMSYGPGQTISALYTGDYNFIGGVSTVSITVNPPDFTLGANVPSLMITAGQSGSATVTATPQGSVSSLVSLACSPFPIPGATCSFSPSSQLNLSNGTAASVTMTITTIAPSPSPTTQFTVPKPPRGEKIPPGRWLFVFADGLAVLILSLWSDRKYRRLAASFGMVCLLFLAVGCGSSGGGGGGAGGGPVPTTLTLTASALKVPSGTTVSMGVTVHSTQAATGTVTLGEPGLQYGPATMINGTATFQLPNLPVGTHVIGAAYSGDANNQGSQTSGTVAVVITGTVPISVSGTTGTLTHTTPVSVTIQ